MKLIIKVIILFALIILPSAILTNCHPARNASKGEASPIKNLDEDFDMFYNKFHNDSLFQLSRTRFPIGGMSVDGFNELKWTRDNLPLLKTRIYDIDTTQYKVTFKKTQKTFTEKVWIENSGFSFECKFELIDNKWYLVYVLDQNL